MSSSLFDRAERREPALDDAVSDDAVVFLRETPDERVLVATARAPWPGTELPGHLARDVDTLHGPDLDTRGGVLCVPGEGPMVGIWRLA